MHKTKLGAKKVVVVDLNAQAAEEVDFTQTYAQVYDNLGIVSVLARYFSRGIYTACNLF